jgi:hypothetical protein
VRGLNRSRSGIRQNLSKFNSLAQQGDAMLLGNPTTWFGSTTTATRGDVRPVLPSADIARDNPLVKLRTHIRCLRRPAAAP